MAYDIFFRGEALAGEDVNQVKQHFAKLFKADDTKLAQLFSGKVIALKKQLSKDEALKYQQLFKKAGAKIYIKQSAVSNNSEPSPAEKTTTAPPVTEKPSAPTATAANMHSTLQALPVGSDVLSDEERAQQQTASIKVDTSGISLGEQGPLPSIETPKVAAPDTSHLTASISEQPLQQAHFTPKDVDTSAYSLAEAGSRILDYYDDIPTPLPQLPHLSLAETGSLLTEPKEVNAKAPDTSHISISPNN